MRNLETLKTYIQTENYHQFSLIDEDLFFWVDWGEEDDSIIKYCENCIKTGTLTATLNYEGNDYMLAVNYKNKVTKIKVLDNRDPSLILLNQIIQPEYELRFLKYSDGSDTLAFIPLYKEEWSNLEDEFGTEKVNKIFEVINEDSKMFSEY